jgi:hypothetical protein
MDKAGNNLAQHNNNGNFPVQLNGKPNVVIVLRQPPWR